jgi:hypothetical protein
MSDREQPANALVAALIGPVFLVTAAWFIWGPQGKVPPVAERVIVSADAVRPATVREKTAEPILDVAGFDKKCQECHALFSSPTDAPLRLNQHRNIVQAHGMNDQCFNCHDREDRDRLALPRGRTISFAESERLCATCHGTTYRDWQRGMHGRTSGSWDASSGRQARLTCLDCHDPHAPAFAPMATLPGPNTLRMLGSGPPETVHAPSRNPLRQWSRDEHAEESHP